jgi:hypothetical protein
MINIKFVVKVDRGGTRAAAYVQRIDRTPVQMTTNRICEGKQSGAVTPGCSLPSSSAPYHPISG